MRGLSSKRVLAYFVDCLILLVLMNLIVSVLPNKSKMIKLNEEIMETIKDYSEQKIEQEEYMKISENQLYELQKVSNPSKLISIFIYFLYFVVFQRYNSGQTPGKLLFKLRTVKVNGEDVTFKELLIRSSLLFGLVINLILGITIYFVNKANFLMISNSLTYIQYLIFLGCVIGIMLPNRRGLHDVLAGTIVIDDNTNYKEYLKKEADTVDKIINNETVESERSSKNERINRTRTSKKK